MAKKPTSRARQAGQGAPTVSPVVTPAGRATATTRVRQFFGGSAPVATLKISKPVLIDDGLDLTPTSFTPPASTASSSILSRDSLQSRGRPHFYIGTPPPSPPAGDFVRLAREARVEHQAQAQAQPELGSPLALITEPLAPKMRARARRGPPPPIKIPSKRSLELQEAVLRTQAAEAEVGLFGIGIGIGIGLNGGPGGKGGGTPIAIDASFDTPPLRSRLALGRANFTRSLTCSTSSSSDATSPSTTHTTSSPDCPDREARLRALAAVLVAQNILLPDEPTATLSPSPPSATHLAVASAFSATLLAHPNSVSQTLALPPLSPLAALSPLSIGADAPPAPSVDSNSTWEFKSWMTPSPLLELEFAKPTGVHVSALVSSFERLGGGGGRSIPSRPFSTTAFAHGAGMLSVPPTPSFVTAHGHITTARERSPTVESALTAWSQSTGYSPVLYSTSEDRATFATPEMETESSSDDEAEIVTPEGTPVKVSVATTGTNGKAYKRMGCVVFSGQPENGPSALFGKVDRNEEAEGVERDVFF